MNNKKKASQKTQFPDLLNVSVSRKKRTRKSKNTDLDPQETTPTPKKYQTTKKKEKVALLERIRRIVDPNFLNETWNQTVVKYKPPEYKGLLSQLYPKLTAAEIRAKWKNVKRMLNSVGKSDGRGGALLLTEEEKKEFKGHLEDVIKNEMKTRCFKVLRKHVLPKIKEIFANNGRKLPLKPFKKHFWSYYLKEPENLEVKVAWKSLPRTKPQIPVRDDDSDSSFISDMLDQSEINDDNNSSPIFEEDDMRLEGNILFPEVVKDVESEKWCQFEEEFNDHLFKELIPIEKFLKENFLIEEDKGILKEEAEIEVPFLNFDNDIMNLFYK